jgi:hypothetical protein
MLQSSQSSRGRKNGRNVGLIPCGGCRVLVAGNVPLRARAPTEERRGAAQRVDRLAAPLLFSQQGPCRVRRVLFPAGRRLADGWQRARP